MAAKGSAVGTGYVLIKPSLDEAALASVEAQGSKSGGGFGNAFSVAAGNLISSAVEKLGSAVADTFKTAFNNYANYEQLVGGVDTLFKESSDIVQKNAANAFKTAGMSANEYMENVTSFSASLLQSLGGNTKEAAAYADRAMVDMSDNANKMGTDMGRITDAYQGFAKDNYTMLDNLKLGYGGTKAEMQRLIKDAAAMTDVQEELGIKVDESSMSFGNVVNAISVMQKSMGIAGTTAEEGSKTISGSINKLSASWNNFLTGIFDDKADVGVLGEQLFESVGDVLQNVAPRIGVLVQRLIQGLPAAMTETLAAIPSMLAPAITSIFGEQLGGQIVGELDKAIGGIKDTVGQVIAQVVEVATPILEQIKTELLPSLVQAVMGIAATVQNVWTSIQPVLQTAFDFIAAMMPVVIETITTVVDFITQSVLPTVNQILDTVRPVIEQIASDISDKMPAIQETVGSAMDLVKKVIDEVWPHVRDIVTEVMGNVADLIQRVWPQISDAIDAAMRVINRIIEVAWPAIQWVIDDAMGKIKTVIDVAWPVIATVVEDACGKIDFAVRALEALIGVVSGVFDGVRRAIEDPIGTAQKLVEDFVNTIQGVIGGMRLELPSIALPHFNVWGGEFPYGIGGMGSAPDFSVDWYGKGGFADKPTLTGYGERGLEMYWPSYGSYFDKYAQGIAEHMPNGGGVDIHDCTFNVREESDIRRVAQKLNTLINRQTTGAFA